MLKKEVPVPDVGVFSLIPFRDTVVVELDPISSILAMAHITILWEEMTDMDALYEKCKEMQLKSFKPVALALATMYSNRTLYEALQE